MKDPPQVDGALPEDQLPPRELATLEITLQSEPSEPRLDRFLAQRWAQHSRAAYQKLIKAGRVRVNGTSVTKPSAELHQGDHLHVTLMKRKPLGIVPEPIPIDVLYEDDDFLAVNKAPGILVHPARGNPHGTLVNAVAHHAERLSTGGDPYRPGVIHRLDRDTSGVILFAKHDDAHLALARQWEARTVRKQYVALVEGVPQLDADVVDQPLGKDPKVRERYAVRRDGKAAHSQYEVVERFHGFALVHVWPKTGRTHQIRIHMAHVGHAVVADRMYGSGRRLTLRQVAGDALPADEADEVLIDRQALHAAALELRHPSTGEPMRLEAPLPKDMRRTLEALRHWRAAGRT